LYRYIEVPWQPAPGVEKNAYVIFTGLAFMFNQGGAVDPQLERRLVSTLEPMK
jgi:hypothetical protein